MAEDRESETQSEETWSAQGSRRARALLLDLVVLAILTFFLSSTFGVVRVTGGVGSTSAGFRSYTTSNALDWWVLSVVTLAYFTIPELLFGATPGKLLLGLRVVGVGGVRPTASAILVRNLLRILDGLPAFYLLGGLVVLLSPRHQRIGDRWAGREVVLARSVRWWQTRWQPLANLILLLTALVTITGGLVFAYLGRPPLVVAGQYNQRQIVFSNAGPNGYQLSDELRTPTTVTYTVGYRAANGSFCHGRLTLNWEGIIQGWQPGGGSTVCAGLTGGQQPQG